MEDRSEKDMDQVKEGAFAKAVCLELLATSFRYPTRELAEAVSSGEWAEAALEVADALGLRLPAGFECDARAHAGEDSERLFREMRAEATRLFIGAPVPAVSPYEGVWRAEDDGVQALLFVNPHSMAVERFCRSCGLGRPEGTNEPLDHVATELELMQRIASLAAGIAEPAKGAPAPGDLPGGSPGGACERFLAEHALVWMPRFSQRVAEASRLPFYRASASFLSALIGGASPRE